MSNFNLDLGLALTSQTVKDYLLTHSTNGLSSLINLSAHPTPTSSKIIDHIFSNTMSSQCITSVLEEHFSDHLPLVISDMSVKLSTQLPDPPSRHFSKPNTRAYFTLLKNVTFLIDDDDVKGSFDSFFKIITGAAETAFPLRPSKKSKKLLLIPWITKGLIKSVTTKKKIFTA